MSCRFCCQMAPDGRCLPPPSPPSTQAHLKRLTLRARTRAVRWQVHGQRHTVGGNEQEGRIVEPAVRDNGHGRAPDAPAPCSGQAPLPRRRPTGAWRLRLSVGSGRVRVAGGATSRARLSFGSLG